MSAFHHQERLQILFFSLGGTFPNFGQTYHPNILLPQEAAKLIPVIQSFNLFWAIFCSDQDDIQIHFLFRL